MTDRRTEDPDLVADSDIEYELIGPHDVQESKLVYEISKILQEQPVNSWNNFISSREVSPFSDLIERCFKKAELFEKAFENEYQDSLQLTLSEDEPQESAIMAINENSSRQSTKKAPSLSIIANKDELTELTAITASNDTSHENKHSSLEDIIQPPVHNNILDITNADAPFEIQEPIGSSRDHREIENDQDNHAPNKQQDKDQEDFQLFLQHQNHNNSFYNLRRRTFRNIYPYIADQCDHLDLIPVQDLEAAHKDSSVELIVKALNKIYIKKKKKFPKDSAYKKRSFYQVLGDHTKHQLGDNHNKDNNDDERSKVEDGNDIFENGYSDGKQSDKESESDASYISEDADDNLGVTQLEELHELHELQELPPNSFADGGAFMSQDEENNIGDTELQNASGESESESDVREVENNQFVRVGGKVLSKKSMFKGVLPESAKKMMDFLKPVQKKTRKNKAQKPRKGLAVKKTGLSSKIASLEGDDFIDDLYHEQPEESLYHSALSNSAQPDRDFDGNSLSYNIEETHNEDDEVLPLSDYDMYDDDDNNGELSPIMEPYYDDYEDFENNNDINGQFSENYISDIPASYAYINEGKLPWSADNHSGTLIQKNRKKRVRSEDSSDEDEILNVDEIDILNLSRNSFFDRTGMAEEDNSFDRMLAHSRGSAANKKTIQRKKKRKNQITHHIQSHPEKKASYKNQRSQILRASNKGISKRYGTSESGRRAGNIKPRSIGHHSNKGPRLKDSLKSTPISIIAGHNISKKKHDKQTPLTSPDDRYMLHRPAQSFNTQIEVTNGQYKLIKNRDRAILQNANDKVAPDISYDMSYDMFDHSDEVYIKPLTGYSYDNSMLLHSIDLKKALHVDKEYINPRKDTVSITLLDCVMNLSLLNVEEATNNVNKCLDMLCNAVSVQHKAESHEIYKSLKGLIEWYLIVQELPSQENRKKLDSLIDVLIAPQNLTRQNILRLPYLILLFHIFRCLYKKRNPHKKAASLDERFDKLLSVYVKGLFSFYDESLYESYTRNGVFTLAYESIFIAFQLLGFNNSYAKYINQTLLLSEMNDPIKSLNMLLALSSVNHECTNWDMLLIILDKIMDKNYLTDDTLILFFKFMIDSIFLLSQKFGWKLEEKVIASVYGIISGRSFENFSKERSDFALVKDIPSGNITDADNLNTRFLKLLTYYSETTKISGRLVEKLIPLGNFRSNSSSSISLSGLVNRVNIVLILYLLTSRDLTNQMNRLLNLFPESDNPKFLEKAFEAVSSFIDIHVFKEGSYPIALVKDFGAPLIEKYKKNVEQQQLSSWSFSKQENVLNLMKAVILKIQKYIENEAARSVVNIIDAFTVIGKIGIFSLNYDDISTSKRALLEDAIHASESLLCAVENENLSSQSVYKTQKFLEEPISEILSRKLYSVNKNDIFQGTSLIIRLIKVWIRSAALLVKNNVKTWNFYVFQRIPYFRPPEQQDKYDLVFYQNVIHYAGSSYLREVPDTFVELLMRDIVKLETNYLYDFVLELYRKDPQITFLAFRNYSIGSLTESSFLMARTQFTINLISNVSSSKVIDSSQKEKYLTILSRSLKTQCDLSSNDISGHIWYKKYAIAVVNFLNRSSVSYLKHSKEFSDLRSMLGISRIKDDSNDFRNTLELSGSLLEALIFIERELVSSVTQNIVQEFNQKLLDSINENLKDASSLSEEVGESKLLPLVHLVCIHLQIAATNPSAWILLHSLLTVLSCIIHSQRNFGKIDFRCIFTLIAHLIYIPKDQSHKCQFYQLGCYQKIFCIMSDVFEYLNGFEDAKHYLELLSFFRLNNILQERYDDGGNSAPKVQYIENINSQLILHNFSDVVKVEFNEDQLSHQETEAYASYNQFLKLTDNNGVIDNLNNGSCLSGVLDFY